jgi:hypothetical protein
MTQLINWICHWRKYNQNLAILACSSKVDDGNRLAISCSSKTNTGCSWQVAIYELVVINLLTTCYEQTISDLLRVCWPHQPCYKMITTCSLSTTGNKQCEHILLTSCYRSANKLLQRCSQAVDKLCSHCLFPVVGTSLEQVVNNLQQAWWHYQTCCKVVLTSLIQSW